MWINRHPVPTEELVDRGPAAEVEDHAVFFNGYGLVTIRISDMAITNFQCLAYDDADIDALDRMIAMEAAP